MAVRLKTKLSLGLGFLFLVILTFGILSLYYINRLSGDANRILKNNYESLVYSNNMLKALEDIPSDSNAITIFNANLRNQEANITEAGEREVTEALRKNFKELLSHRDDSANYAQLRESIRMINDLNQEAILKKNAIAGATAESAQLWLTIIFTTLILIVLTFIYNFPGVIAEPVAKLAEGIREIIIRITANGFISNRKMSLANWPRPLIAWPVNWMNTRTVIWPNLPLKKNASKPSSTKCAMGLSVSTKKTYPLPQRSGRKTIGMERSRYRR